MAGLALKNIRKSFDGALVLKDINLNLAEGELVVLLGPSGCGKSTLLRIIAGLETADAGEIFISKKRIDQKQPKDRNVALVFQNYALYPHMTVEKNLSFPLAIAKVSKLDQKKKVIEVAEMLGLSDKLDQRPASLSGGERQRVALGRAIIREPAIFLLDEPLSNLDAELRGRMRREIVTLQRRLKKTLIHVTHDQTEALTMADRIVLMNKGEIVQIGTPQELYQNPVDLFAAKFIGQPSINIIKSKVINGLLESLKVPIASLKHSPKFAEVYVGVRPENIQLNPNGNLEGRIESLEYLGGQMIYRIDFAGMRLTSLASYSDKAPGDVLRFSILPEAVILFDAESKQRLVN